MQTSAGLKLAASFLWKDVTTQRTHEDWNPASVSWGTGSNACSSALILLANEGQGGLELAGLPHPGLLPRESQREVNSQHLEGLTPQCSRTSEANP